MGLIIRFCDKFRHFEQKALVGKQKYAIWKLPKHTVTLYANITVAHINAIDNSYIIIKEEDPDQTSPKAKTP